MLASCFRSALLALALGSVIACATPQTGKDDEGSTGSELSKGKKGKGDASADGTTDVDGGQFDAGGGDGVGCNCGCNGPDAGYDDLDAGPGPADTYDASPGW